MEDAQLQKPAQPTQDDGEQSHVLTPFAPFRPDGPTTEDFQNSLLFASLADDYLPFRSPVVAALSELFDAARGDKSESERRVAITGEKGTRLRELQLQVQENQDRLAKIEQQMAASDLFDAVNWGIFMIDALVRDRPEMMSELASSMCSWPVEVSLDSNWVTIAERLRKLNLNQCNNEPRIEPPFRPAQGDDSQLPARWWAKQASRCITLTRHIQKRLQTIQIPRSLEGKLAVTTAPAWATKARDLPDLSADKKVLHEWGTVIRQMIREQMPDFHNRTEWIRFKNSSRTRSKKRGALPTKGDIQNAILDDINAALKTIAPRQPSQKPL